MKKSSGNRLLKTASTSSMVGNNLNLPPLRSSAISKTLEEDLESQARAALAPFSFGTQEAYLNWSAVQDYAGDKSLSSSSSGKEAMSASGGPTGAYAVLSERVAPVGVNAFLWNLMNNNGDALAASAVNDTSTEDTPATDNDETATPHNGSLGSDNDNTGGHSSWFTSKSLQQYYCKSSATLPATVAEVVDAVNRSDKEECTDFAMQYFVGVKNSASGLIYRRPSTRKRGYSRPYPGTQRPSREMRRKFMRRHKSSSMGRKTSGSAPSTPDRDMIMRRMQKHQSESESSDDEEKLSDMSRPPSAGRMFGGNSKRSSWTMKREESTGGSESDSMESVEELSLQDLGRHVRRASASSPTEADSPPMDPTTTTFPPPNMKISAMQEKLPPTSEVGNYMDEYDMSFDMSGNQGHMTIKWVVGEKSGRMFGSRAHFVLLDYECVIIDDWAPNYGPMYIRILQSIYLPQCQPWTDEFPGRRPTDLQPVGFMVRPSRTKEDHVDIQFVGSVLEKMQLPMASRRAKLKQLAFKLPTKLQELLTSRRLSQSLRTHQPLWVHNRERIGCKLCDARFGLSRRRHHCRLCGEVCCADCSPKVGINRRESSMLSRSTSNSGSSKSVRVCISCLQRRRPSDEATGNNSSGGSASQNAKLSPTKGLGYGGWSSASSYNLSMPSPPLSVSDSQQFQMSRSATNVMSPSAHDMHWIGSMGEKKHSLSASVLRRKK